MKKAKMKKPKFTYRELRAISKEYEDYDTGFDGFDIYVYPGLMAREILQLRKKNNYLVLQLLKKAKFDGKSK